jgi:RND family efflux transporter MFP subunit
MEKGLSRFKIIIIVSLLVLVAIVGVCRLRKSGDGKSPSDKPLETRKIERGTFEVALNLTGTIEPSKQVTIKSEIGGKIEKLYHELGDEVGSGEVLVELNKKALLSDLRVSESALEIAKSRLDQATAELELACVQIATSLKNSAASLAARKTTLSKQTRELSRIKKLDELGLVAPNAVEDAAAKAADAHASEVEANSGLEMSKSQRLNEAIKEAEVAILRAQVSQAADAIVKAREQLSYATIRAPLAGTIIVKEAEEGEVVTGATYSSTSASPILVIGALEKLIIHVRINEVDIAKARVGQSAEVTIDAFRSKVFKGTLVSISPYASTDQTKSQSNVKEFDAKVEITDSERLIKPGMTGNIHLLMLRIPNVFYAPRECVFEEDGKKKIFVVKNDKPTELVVETGDENETQVVIRKGLEGTAEISISYQGKKKLDEKSDFFDNVH